MTPEPNRVIQVPDGQKPVVADNERVVPLASGVKFGDKTVDYYDVREKPRPNNYLQAQHASKD